MIYILNMKNEALFSDIIGHSGIKDVLQRAFLSQRIAHAYLFSGAEGLGKYKTAWAFAHMLQCICAKQGARCLACNSTTEQIHPDIAIIAPQGATIKIEQIREIQRDIQFAPRTGNYKIFILDGVEKLTLQAANSLLKMLEEPPKHVIFLLLTVQMHSVLPTIVSRCQNLTFAAVPDKEIAAWLAQQGFPADKAAAAAVISGGSPGRAMLWAETGQGVRDQIFEQLELLQQSPPGRIWDAVAKLEQERDQILSSLEIISIILRDCLVWQTTSDPELLLYKDCGSRVAALAQTAKPDELLAICQEIDKLRRMLLGNANSRLLLERLCLRLQDALAIQGGSC